MADNEAATDGDQNRRRTDQRSWKDRADPIFWAGLGVGMLLAIGGFVSIYLALVGNTTSLLILCSGLGIIFGAFGSTATVKYKGIVITGVAAIAIVLLLLVDHLIEDNYVELEIVGDVRGAQIIVAGDENYLGAERERKHKFIVIAKKIRRKFLYVEIDPPSDPQGGDNKSYIFECVHKDELEPYLGSGEIVQWRFDKDKAQLLDAEQQRKIADEGPCPRRADAAPHIERSGQNWIALLGSKIVSSALAADRQDTQMLIRDLEAKSAFVRRGARQSLADQGLPAVRPMLDALASDDASFRTQLGAVVALTEMLRERKDQRKEFSALLTEADLGRLVDAAAHKERTMRIYASEFLFDLGDPRVVPAVFERFETADDSGRYNLTLVLEGTYPYLNDSEKAAVGRQLSAIHPSVGQKIRQSIDRIVGTQPTDQQRYWVIVGSYTDKSEAQAHARRINDEDESLKAFVGMRQPDNPYYPVIVGDYVLRPQADEFVKSSLGLKSVREYGSAPYLSSYAERR